MNFNLIFRRSALLPVLTAGLLLYCGNAAAQLQYELRSAKQAFLTSPNDTASVAFTIRNHHQALEIERQNSEWGRMLFKTKGMSQLQTGYVRLAELEAFEMLAPTGGQQWGAFKVTADSIVLRSIPDGPTKAVYKGEIIPLNRAYTDRYAFYGKFEQESGNKLSVYVTMEDKQGVTSTSERYDTAPMIELARAAEEFEEAQIIAQSPDNRWMDWLLWIGFIVIVVAGRYACVKLRVILLKNKNFSNKILFWIFLISSSYLIWKVGAILFDWLEGWAAVIAVLACLLYWFWVAVENRNIVDERCPQCRNYPNNIRMTVSKRVLLPKNQSTNHTT